MEFLQEITLELNSNTAYTTVGAKQGDSRTRNIKVNITQNGTPWTIPSSASASYRVRKPDGYAIWNDASIDLSENAIYIELTEQTLAAAGRAYADVLLTQGTGENREVLSTVSFIIIIMAAPDITKNVASSNEFSSILDLTNNADVILNEAEAWAAGTKNTEPVIGPNFEYVIEGGNFTCNINETTFRNKVGQSPGYTREFVFTCTGTPQGSTTPGWSLSYGSTTLPNIVLSEYGISITSGTPLQSNIIRITMTDKDLQYENNAKYYAEQIKNLGVSAVAVAPGSNPTVTKDSSGTYLNLIFGIPSGERGEPGITSAKASASSTINYYDPPTAIATLSNNTLYLEFGIPPAAPGGGDVDTVDSIGPVNGNVVLGAVRYTTAQDLDDTAKLQARLNIGAQASGDYLIVPSVKTYGQFLQYGGTVADPSWVTTNILQVPSGGTTGQVIRKTLEAYSWDSAHELPAGGTTSQFLVKNSNDNYDCGWASITMPAIPDEVITALTSSDISDRTG